MEKEEKRRGEIEREGMGALLQYHKLGTDQLEQVLEKVSVEKLKFPKSDVVRKFLLKIKDRVFDAEPKNMRQDD